MQPWSPSGLQTVPHLKWGSHVAHFFGSGDELRDVLVPYFKAGLENNERCLWVTGKALNAEQARSALRAAVPDLDARERKKQIEIANGDEWYAADEKLQPEELVKGKSSASGTRSNSDTRVLEPTGIAPGYRKLNGRISRITKRWFRKPSAADA